MKEKAMKTYIFDLDGTLIDSMTMAWEHLLLKYLVDRNIDYPNDLIKSVITLGFAGVAKYYKEHFPIVESEKEIVAYFLKEMQVLYNERIPAKPYVLETLQILKERGASLNVLTASPHCFLDPCLKRLGMTEYFDHLWSGEDFPTTKADPKIYKLAAERLGRKVEDCVMVDDSIVAIKSAKEAGLQTIGVYDEVSKEYENELRAVGDQYIYTFQELQ